MLDNIVLQREAGAKEFSFWNAENPATIYSAEPRAVWDWVNAVEVPATPATQRPNKFLLAGSVFEGLREVGLSARWLLHSTYVL